MKAVLQKTSLCLMSFGYLRIFLMCALVFLSHGYQSSFNRMRNVFVVVNETDHLFIWGDDMNFDTLMPGITQVASSLHAVAVVSNGQLFAWGEAMDGGVLPATPPSVVSITSSDFAFAAITSDARAYAWGSSSAGGTIGDVDNSNVVNITSTSRAFAALTSSGRVFTWGDADFGGNSSAVASQLQSGVRAIYANYASFAALTSTWQLITWGNAINGGDSSLVQAVFDGRSVETIVATRTAFCALFTDGTVVPWGNEQNGGVFTFSSIQPKLASTSVRLIASTIAAFAVTTAAGDVLAWGDASHGGAFDASNLDVVQLASNARAFAAVLSDGSVIGWGGTNAGGSVSGQIANEHIRYIVANQLAFAAISDENHVFTYGDVEYGGGQAYDYDVVQIVSNDGAFLVLDDSNELHTIGFNSSHGSGDSFPEKLDGSTTRMIQGAETFRNPVSYDTTDSSSSSFPSQTPTVIPTSYPTVAPSFSPTFPPSSIPSSAPTALPSTYPTAIPSAVPTVLPTSIPTSAPTCRRRYKHEDGSSDCVCKAGTHVAYNASEEVESCRKCAIGTYSKNTHNSECEECEWPSYNFQRGSTECSSLCLCFSSTTLVFALIPFIALFLCCVWAADGSRYAVFVILFFPTLDVFSDVLYIATTTFYSNYIFYAAVFFVLLPTAFFVQELVHLKAFPQILWWPFSRHVLSKPSFAKDFWWLGCQGTSPTCYGEKVALMFQHHDGIPHLVAFLLTWLLLLTAQMLSSILMLLWPIFGIFFLSVWFMLGLFFHLTKVSAIGKVRTMWYFVWTCSNKHRNLADVDLGVLNRGLFSEFVLETLPQLALQAYNNEETHIWTLIAQFSALLSLFIAVNGSYRFLYWTLYVGQPIEEIDLGIVVRMLGAKPMTRKALHKHMTERRLASKKNVITSHQSSDSDVDALTASPMDQLGKVLMSDGNDVHPVKSLVRIASQSNRMMSARIQSLRSMSMRGSFARYKATSVHPFEPQSTEKNISMSDKHPIEHRKRPANLIPYILAVEEEHEAEEEVLQNWRLKLWNIIENENNYIEDGGSSAVMSEYCLEMPADLKFLTFQEVRAIAAKLKPVMYRKLLHLWTGKLAPECIGDAVPQDFACENDQVTAYVSRSGIDSDAKL